MSDADNEDDPTAKRICHACVGEDYPVHRSRYEKRESKF